MREKSLFDTVITDTDTSSLHITISSHTALTVFYFWLCEVGEMNQGTPASSLNIRYVSAWHWSQHCVLPAVTDQAQHISCGLSLCSAVIGRVNFNVNTLAECPHTLTPWLRQFVIFWHHSVFLIRLQLLQDAAERVTTRSKKEGTHYTHSRLSTPVACQWQGSFLNSYVCVPCTK